MYMRDIFRWHWMVLLGSMAAGTETVWVLDQCCEQHRCLWCWLMDSEDWWHRKWQKSVTFEGEVDLIG